MLTFAVVAEGHLVLAKANGVLSSANTIELLELGLLDILLIILWSVGVLSDVGRRCRMDVTEERGAAQKGGYFFGGAISGVGSLT